MPYTIGMKRPTIKQSNQINQSPGSRYTSRLAVSYDHRGRAILWGDMMSMPSVEVVDLQHNNEKVDLKDLTETALGSLVHDCDRLREKLADLAAQNPD